MIRGFGFVVLAGLLLVAGGCASSLTGESYSRGAARSVQEVDFGTVVAVRAVSIEGTKTPVGAGAGAIIGGLAGSTLGGGRGSDIAAVAGAVAGGLAGAAAEEGLTRKPGVEVTVRLDSGRTIAIVQAAAPNESFAVGDRVRVLYGRDGTRVTR